MAGMDKPSKIYPLSPNSTSAFMPPQIQDPSLRGASFDQLIENRGIRFIHRKSLPCPNLKDLDQNSHDPLCVVCDGSGLLYYHEKEIYGLFYSNSLERMFEHHGVWEVGNAVVTLPTHYDDGEEADFNMFDQLVIPDFTVRTWELKEYRPTADNSQYMRYPIQKIDYLASAQNDVLKVYQEGVDYVLDHGSVKWLPGKQPSYDNVNERGDVYVIAYYMNPVYTVLQHLRELRITQEMDETGHKVSKRLPQSLVIKRDFMVNYPEGTNN